MKQSLILLASLALFACGGNDSADTAADVADVADVEPDVASLT